MRKKVIITVTALVLTAGGVCSYLSSQASTTKAKCGQTCMPSCCDEDHCLPGSCDCDSCE